MRNRPAGREARCVRPGTTIALALILVAIFTAAIVQLLILGKG